MSPFKDSQPPKACSREAGCSVVLYRAEASLGGRVGVEGVGIRRAFRGSWSYTNHTGAQAEMFKGAESVNKEMLTRIDSYPGL